MISPCPIVFNFTQVIIIGNQPQRCYTHTISPPAKYNTYISSLFHLLCVDVEKATCCVFHTTLLWWWYRTAKYITVVWLLILHANNSQLNGLVFFKAQLLIVYINTYVLTDLYYLLLTSFNYRNSIMSKVNSMQYLCLSILMMLAEISISSFNFKFQKAAWLEQRLLMHDMYIILYYTYLFQERGQRGGQRPK